MQHQTWTDRDLQNAEIIEYILRKGTDEELRRLAEFHKLSPEQIDHLRFDERERERSHTIAQTDKDQRMAENPHPTEDELLMGAFIEQIEPHVRDAVKMLRKKGYATWESGYVGGAAQRISFNQEALDDFAFPAELVESLLDQGITVDVGNEMIEMRSSKPMALDDWKRVWDKVAEALPDLGKPAAASMTGAAQDFREQYSESSSG